MPVKQYKIRTLENQREKKEHPNEEDQGKTESQSERTSRLQRLQHRDASYLRILLFIPALSLGKCPNDRH